MDHPILVHGVPAFVFGALVGTFGAGVAIVVVLLGAAMGYDAGRAGAAADEPRVCYGGYVR